MIICEGPDNSGKTTLCEQLSAHLGLPVMHSGGPINSAGDYAKRLGDLFTMKTHVMDRFPSVSENIYGSIFGRNHNIIFSDGLRHALARGWMFIYCRPPNDHLLDFTKHRPSDHAPAGVEPAVYHRQIEARALSIINRYDEVMATIPHIRYDFTSAEPGFYSNLALSCKRFSL